MPERTFDRAETAERFAGLKRKEGYVVQLSSDSADGWRVTWSQTYSDDAAGARAKLERELAQAWQEYDIRAAVHFTTGRFDGLVAEAAVRYAAASRAMIQAGLNPDPTAIKLPEPDLPF